MKSKMSITNDHAKPIIVCFEPEAFAYRLEPGRSFTIESDLRDPQIEMHWKFENDNVSLYVYATFSLRS